MSNQANQFIVLFTKTLAAATCKQSIGFPTRESAEGWAVDAARNPSIEIDGIVAKAGQ
jgi:hypothetical protein